MDENGANDKDNEAILPLKQVLKDTLLNWCEASTAHAIPNIVRSKNFAIKFIWLCCLIASGSYCIVSVVVCIQSYMSNQAFISFHIVLDPVANFPAVTLCNLKMMNKIRANDYIESVLSTLVNHQLFDADFPNNLIDDQRFAIRTKIAEDVNLTENGRAELGFRLEETLLTCSYSWEPCTVDDFTYAYHPLYGNCYAFNKDVSNIKKSSLPGPNYGLTMELFVGSPQLQLRYESNDGVIIVVHNQSSVPTMNHERVLASTGADTDIKVNRNFITRLGPPYSDCLKDIGETSQFQSVHFQYLVNTLKKPYTQNLCYVLCFQKLIEFECGCMLGVLLKYKEAKTCKATNETQCAGRKINELQKGASSSCIGDCPMPCDMIEYRVTTSKAKFPTEYYRDLLTQHSVINKSGVAYSDIEKSVLRVNVFYETMTYSATVETPATTPETFFSNIGGTLGLYLGISVLSAIEIVELMVKIWEILWLRYGGTHKIPTKTEN